MLFDLSKTSEHGCSQRTYVAAVRDEEGSPEDLTDWRIISRSTMTTWIRNMSRFDVQMQNTFDGRMTGLPTLDLNRILT